MSLRNVPSPPRSPEPPVVPEPVVRRAVPPSVRLPEGMDVVCYDSETTGSDKACCQILQFGAVRLDGSFVETEALELKVKLLPYLVPSVGALDVTGVDVTKLEDEDRLDEFDAARVIDDMLRPRDKLRRLHLTFNGISYDDEVIRRTLYRNLRYPYFSGVTRIDLLPLCQAIRLSGDPGLRFMPPDETGRSRTRLVDMCAANGIDLGDAHDAVADTRATAKLAERIRTNVPWAWDMAFACGSAAEVTRHLSHKGATWVLDTFATDPLSAAKPYAFLGVFGDKRNLALLVDAMHFYENPVPDVLPDVKRMQYSEKDAPPLPFRLVALNKSALILRPEDVLRYVSREDMLEMDDAASRLQSRRSEVERIRAHVAEGVPHMYEGRALGPSSEERIYGTRQSKPDNELRDAFQRAASWNARVHIDFKDARLSDFAARILLRHLGFDGVARYSNNDKAALFLERAAEAFGRPFAPAGEDRDRGWATIDGCLSDERCTAEYAAWLANSRRPPEDAGPVDDDEDGYGPGPGGP